MPFFVNNGWMQSIDKLWLWFVLTVPSTTLCFTFYFIWNRNESRRKRASYDDDEEMVALDAVPAGSSS